ncbi:MAG TPA: transcription elongation factor GreA [Spirochaetota bacterium]|nr:transcription elongation factor GreA [Spirochaetota bacterium]HOL56920.1 transcription elongation factor GreA [Spirochaetota bacterium]HPP04615.1 transcription elongation factor GreA [Spirochaetota bacterium]
MSDNKIIQNLENLLNEEKWTRATINNYTIKNFEDLNLLIESFREKNLIKEATSITEEYLKHNKNSIIALYIYSMLQFQDGNYDDTYVLNLLKIFSDNLKWNIVEFLCKKFLYYADIKSILRILIEAENNLNKKDELPNLWERLIKVDYEEAEAALKLAEYKEKNSDIDEALSYYKKAINRFIVNKNFNQVEELWKKLTSFDNISYEYFINLEKKISKHFNNERAIDLLKYLYEIYALKDEFDVCLKILKLILEKNPDDLYGRKEIVSIYRKKYKDHSLLEEYIQRSGLEAQWRNINDAIASFEKHIVFDKGNFVYHRTWGIGRIVSIEKDIFTIDFQKKKGHTMSLNMAIDSLKTLQKNHIWVLKLKDIEKLKQKVKEDIPWALKILIQSYDNRISMKNIKEELVPDVLSPSSWNSWWANAKKVLKTDAKFGTIDEASDIYEMRDKPLSYDEKIYNSFKAIKDFNQRFNLILDFIENGELDSENFTEMLQYFQTFLNSVNNVNEQVVSSYILLTNLQKENPLLKIKIAHEFSEFVYNIEDYIKIYENISIYDYKKQYLLLLKKYHKDWVEIFKNIFYQYPQKFIYDELFIKDKNITNKIILECFVSYKEYREAFFWIVTNILNQEKAKELNIEYDNIILSLIHLIEICHRDINNKKDVTQNKKILNQIKDYLFKTKYICDYIDKADKEFAIRLYAIINELYVLDGEYIVMVKNKIDEKFPDIDKESESLKFDETKAKSSIIDKLLTTEASYKRMQQELIKIKDIEIPENSKEIGWAMEKGDLRENAEYKAAKEKQLFLQNKMSKLMNELSIAKIVKKEEIKADFITFGTEVELLDKNTNNIVKYTILGPWESDSEKNIISYQSPFGGKLLDKKVNDEIKFTLNEKDYHFIVKNIKVADF